MSEWRTLWWVHNTSVHWKYEGWMWMSSSFHCFVWQSKSFFFFLLKYIFHTVPQADLGLFFCIKHSDHAKNFVWPVENFEMCRNFFPWEFLEIMSLTQPRGLPEKVGGHIFMQNWKIIRVRFFHFFWFWPVKCIFCQFTVIFSPLIILAEKWQKSEKSEESGP